MFSGVIFLSIMAMVQGPTSTPTVDALQSDLQTAYPCQGEVDGRKVWKGGLAYYIQSYVYDTKPSDDPTEVATDAVLPADNTEETLKEFEQACGTLVPPAGTVD